MRVSLFGREFLAMSYGYQMSSTHAILTDFLKLHKNIQINDTELINKSAHSRKKSVTCEYVSAVPEMIDWHQ